MDEDCCEKDPKLRQQIESACQMVSAKITDPKLRKCISDQCRDGRVTCGGLYCWLFGKFGWSNAFYGSNLCISGHEWIGGLGLWGCIAIHEWAHGCGWDHPDGGGVPDTMGECVHFLNPIVINPKPMGIR